jgi:hypothetical protein
MSKAPYPRLEHLNFRLDVLSELAKGVASGLYEAECDVTLRDLRVLRFVGMQPGISLGPLIELTYLEKTLVTDAFYRHDGCTRHQLELDQEGQDDRQQVRSDRQNVRRATHVRSVNGGKASAVSLHRQADGTR